MPAPYGTRIYVQAPDNGGGPADPQDDPVLSILAPMALPQDSGPYNVRIPANAASNSLGADAYHSSNNTSAQNGAPSAMPGMPASTRPRDFDRQPNINNASPTGQARILGAKQGRYDGEDTRNVKYINDLKTRRQKYQVEIGATMLRRTMVFDTQEIKQHFVQKKKDSVGSASLGADRSGKAFPTPTEWTEAGLIWVCAPDPESDRPVIYSHVGKPDRFHHSSMVGGGEVIGAGEWIVRKGKLWKISANSGHYQPTIDFLYRAVLQMSSAFNGDTTVFLYDSIDDKWVDYPIRLFISAPTADNRFWTHPRARTM